MKKLYSLLIPVIILASCSDMPQVQVEKWDVFELTLAGPSQGNPYMDIEFSGIFKWGDQELRVPGFYDGDGIYKLRFSPAQEGTWKYHLESNTEALDGSSGSFECIPPGEGNAGPLQVVDTYNFQYADGTPYLALGTTAYQWTSVDQPIQEKTVESLEKGPFNKIRMCVFPKSYIYGNDTEPWRYAFAGDTVPDFTQPDYAFFRNFDRRVEQLMEMGIQADVILFHPYDRWSYSHMGDEMNLKYVRYMIARISAYRNVWWSLANEWDIPDFKERIDWEEIGTTLQKEDPHQRLRGIHNWYNSEDHFYDHSRPWITHTCTQTAQFYNIAKWREQYGKPVTFDEMRYEGDVPSGWGNLSGEEMSAYFWMAALAGAHPTHGETLVNPSDDSTEVRWWAKGGMLVGESPSRISYFREILEATPFHEMTPSEVQGADPKDLMNCVYLSSHPGNYYLAFLPNPGLKLALDLPGNSDYRVEALDTWNMAVDATWTVSPGAFEYGNNKAHTALRIQKAN